MCKIESCKICKTVTECCGGICNIGGRCQLYLPFYFRKHKRSGKSGIFDEEVWNQVNPLWSRVKWYMY